MAPLPIITPAAPVSLKQAEALLASTISPFAITGIETESTILEIHGDME